jgi:hypothetical protein
MKFSWMWILFGLIQILLLQSCQGPGGNSSNADFSNNNSIDVAGQFPLRLSRAFFEHAIEGKFELKDEQGAALGQGASKISWSELEPEGPAPRPGHLADFRDRQGCAEYTDSQGFKVCFTVVPDISSVDLMDDKMSVQGVKNILEKTMSPECASSFEVPRLVKADRSLRELQLSYQANTAQETQVTCATRVIQLEIRIQRVDL